MNQFVKPLLVFSFFILVLSSCKKKEIALPDNLVNFEASAQGFEGNEVEVKINLSRATDVAIPLTVSLTPTKVTYGNEFTTSVSPVNATLQLTIAAGQSGTSFKVIKNPSVFLNGDETIEFKITSAAPAVLGSNLDFKLTFGAITSQGSTLTLEGKTAESNYTNMVYVDLSGNKQTPVNRKSWNIGLTGDGQYRVVLNPSYQTTAVATDKTDINAVTLANPGSSTELNHNVSDAATATLVDSWEGDLTKTVFAEVSANESENKVYLISFEGSKDKDKWFKVKVNRNGTTGYRIQYARLNESSIKTLDVTKNADFNLMFVSLENNKVVEAEPRKASWDFYWAFSTYNSGLGSPYWFQDFVVSNRAGGVKVAEVTSVTYEAFGEANLTGLQFSINQDAIGSKWRVTTGAGIRTDRFYVIQDGAGNIYKLKFVSMGLGSDGGERGKPVVEFKLLKKA